VPDPEHPIAHATRSQFFQPDDTAAGRLYWWSSADVRIDVPSSAPLKNQIANADHVEFESCARRAGDCPAGTLRDASPQRGQAARAYVQVNNIGLRPAANVRVAALVADASTGLPDLPVDFWTTTFPANATTCGALTPGSGWRFADVANPCRVVPTIRPDYPETVAFDWSVPANQAGHSCMLVIAESTADPIDPGVRAANERRLAVLVPNHRHVGLRNLHVVDAMAGAADVMEVMNVANPDPQRQYVDLFVASADRVTGAVVGLLLPGRNGVEADGAQPMRVPLSRPQLARARDLKLSAAAFYRITGREARLRLPIPAGATWQVGVVYRAIRLAIGSSSRLSILARQDDAVLGGNTYVIRSIERRR
jgi:hypothetical protein